MSMETPLLHSTVREKLSLSGESSYMIVRYHVGTGAPGTESFLLPENIRNPVKQSEPAYGRKPGLRSEPIGTRKPRSRSESGAGRKPKKSNEP